MLRRATSLVVNHSNHPYLAGILIVGIGFAVAGVAVQEGVGNGLVGGFLVVYALIAFFLAALGYAIALGGRLVRAYTRETDASL